MKHVGSYDLTPVGEVCITMRTVVQRVSDARLVIDDILQAEISAGLVILAGFTSSDTEQDIIWMVDKIAGLRIFPDDFEKLNLSVVDCKGQVLVVPNFTLYGDCRKGRRPSFTKAAKPEEANIMFDKFCALLAEQVPLERGVFGAHMHVTLTNDGPITLVISSE